MHFDQLLYQAQAFADNDIAMIIPENWGQGRTVFGGVSAALLYAAMQTRVEKGRALRSLTTNFVGPLLVNTPFTFEVEMLREGKSASQITGRIIQNGQVAVIQQGCFGGDRTSNIEVENQERHSMPAPEGLEKLPDIGAGAPHFTQNFDYAIAQGGMPYSGSDDSRCYGWMRFKHAPEAITDAHLISLIDCWPPGVLQMMKVPSPASTMMWNLEFIHPHQPVVPDDWFAYQANTRQAAQGYAHAEANIWDATGELVAISRQSIAVFD
ncbi:thioesterase family protein [Vibrio sp. ZSDZ34]|jgi:acyl-CoA thioesterase|uniref:Thioesterase family protein n=1 Tax=Vibrio gelatinilyticus TaxID=2893468 RepID=A0A9X2AXF9_9VIBR|nr:thioesterase family protein [Vibrio gelatinilyticus]MCJ2375507.1 thioesterase family protein [Vibrio gelatinilyticus]